MSESPPSPPLSDHTELYVRLGRLVVAWNELDGAMRGIIFTLADRDPLTAILLTADLNSSGLMTALRTIVFEDDKTEEVRLANTDSGLREYVGDKIPQPVSPHVNHFLEYCDRLREYRNFYVHGITTPHADEGLVARSMSARGRLSFYHQPISLADLETLTVQINICRDYGNNVSAAISHSREYRYKPKAQPPTWPEKPPLPDKLQKRRKGLRGD